MKIRRDFGSRINMTVSTGEGKRKSSKISILSRFHQWGATWWDNEELWGSAQGRVASRLIPEQFILGISWDSRSVCTWQFSIVIQVWISEAHGCHCSSLQNNWSSLPLWWIILPICNELDFHFLCPKSTTWLLYVFIY